MSKLTAGDVINYNNLIYLNAKSGKCWTGQECIYKELSPKYERCEKVCKEIIQCFLDNHSVVVPTPEVIEELKKNRLCKGVIVWQNDQT